MITLSQSKTALGPGLTASFIAAGGTAPYVFSVAAGGAGGTINSATGVYTAPAVVNPDPAKSQDTILVTDAAALTANSKILVGSPLTLFCEIIEREMGLARGRVYFWDQKVSMPTDSDLFIAVAVLREKIFSNSKSFSNVSGVEAIQSVNVMSQLSVDIQSRGPAARDRRHEVLLALNSVYAEQQQEQNSFLIGKLPPGVQFINLSLVDGAAIPYRFNITVNMQYFVKKQKAVPYFDTFETPTIKVNA